MNEQRKWFLETEYSPGDGAVKIGEKTTKCLEHNVNSVDRAVAGFTRIDSNSERSSLVGKMLSNSSACFRELFVTGRVSQGSKLHCRLIFLFV